MFTARLARCLEALVLLSAVALLAAPTAVGAPLVLRSISDGSQMSKSDLSDLASQLRSNCARKPVVIRSLSLRAALADVQVQLVRNSTANARKKFAASGDARTAGDAAAAVFAAIAADKPWAAIDAALRVQALDPRDADPLVSLAGLIAAQGSQQDAQDALALLNAAAKLPAKSPSPMGIDIRAVADNNRGLALLLLGHPSQAVPLLQSALRKAPELSEAQLNLDAAQQCNHVLLPGGSRSPPPVIADPPLTRGEGSTGWTTDDNGDPVPIASTYLDLSQELNWVPVAIQFPDTPEQGGQMQDYYTTLDGYIGSDTTANSAKMVQLLPLVQDPNSETQHRRDGVWEALNTAHFQPQLRSLWQNFDSAQSTLTADIDIGTADFNGGRLDPSLPAQDALKNCQNAPDFESCYTSVCTSETQALHDKWIVEMRGVNDLDLRYESAFWQYAMAVAANVSDPADHQRMLLDAADSMLADRDLVLQDAKLFLISAEWANPPQCDGGQQTAPNADQPPDQSNSSACPAALKGMKASFKVDDILKFGIACEKVEIELSTKGFLGAFVNVSYNPHSGRTTVFAGGKASVSGPGVEVGAKTGAFVTLGRDGSLVDGGMRVSATAGAGSTPGPGNSNVMIMRTTTVNFSVAGTVPFSE